MNAQQPAKIAVVTRYVSERGGGISTSVNALYGAIAQEKQFSVCIISGDIPTKPVPGVNYVNYATVGWDSYGFSPDLVARLHSEEPDIVHLHGLWTYSSLATSMWARATKRPYLVSPHGMLDPWALSQSALKKRVVGFAYERSLLRNAEVMHALNEAEATAIRSFISGRRLLVVPNGINLVHTSSHVVPDWFEGRKILLFLGRIHPKKGLDLTLRAWRLLRDQSPSLAPDWRLAVVGWGGEQYVNQLKSLAAELGLADSIVFPGAAGDSKDAIFAACEAFILASRSEGQPMAVLEAWSHAKPTFITRECNLCCAFKRGASFEIEPTPQSIAAVLSEKLNDPALLRAVGEAGRALAVEAFNWQNIAEIWLSKYCELLAS